MMMGRTWRLTGNPRFTRSTTRSSVGNSRRHGGQYREKTLIANTLPLRLRSANLAAVEPRKLQVRHVVADDQTMVRPRVRGPCR